MSKAAHKQLNYRLLILNILAGLALIVCLEFISMTMLNRSVESQEQIATSINESGRQRMLIRTLALLSEKFSHGNLATKNILQTTLTQYANAHHSLSSYKSLESFPRSVSLKLDNLYRTPLKGLNDLSIAFVNKVHALIHTEPKSEASIKMSHQIYDMSIGKFFILTNEVVALSEQALIDSKQYAEQLKRYTFYFMCLIIIAEFFLIFLPIVKKVKRSFEQILELSFNDPLTQLGNRSYFIDQAKKAIDRAQRHKRFVAIFYIDLDNFKDINDAFGSHFADQLLTEVGKRLGNVARESDSLVRLGGDDFALLLDDIDSSNNISMIAGRYLKSFNKSFYINDRKINVSISIGIAVFPHAAKNVDYLMTRADTALYKAKSQGKNNYAFYTDVLHLES